MAYAERGVITAAESLLKEAGFTVSQTCCARASCFDFAARRAESLIFIKVQPDLDNLSPNDSLELRDIARSVSGASLLISENSREKPLEDDTVYCRHDVSAVTLKTFENIAMRRTYPLVQAGPGGYYVEIDAETIRRRRQELGLSVGKMAEIVGISRRTLYGYERGLAKASVTAAYNLVYTLGIPVAKTVNVFEKPRSRRKCKLLLTAKRMIEKNRLLVRIFRRSNRYRVTTVRKAPFDFVVTVPDRRMRIIGGVASERERELERRVDEILSVCRVVQAQSVFITDGTKPSNKEISCIDREELSKIKSPEELISSVT